MNVLRGTFRLSILLTVVAIGYVAWTQFPASVRVPLARA